MHEKQVFAVLTGGNDFFPSCRCSKYVRELQQILSSVFQVEVNFDTQNRCAHFLTIKKAKFGYFPYRPAQMWTRSGQSSSGQGCGRQHGGVCFNMSTWKILRGNMDGFCCSCFTVCMLGIGVGPFDLNENAPQRFAVWASSSSAQGANQKAFPPPDFPRFPCRVYLLWSETWEYHGPSPWSISLLAQPASIWHLQWKQSEWVPAVADDQCLHASSHRVHFYINSALSSVCCFSTHWILFCEKPKQPAKQQNIYYKEQKMQHHTKLK